MADTTDLLFIHRTLNIIHDMNNIFLLSQKTGVPFFPSPQTSKLVPFRKACNSNSFSLKKRFTKVVLNYLLKKYHPFFFPFICPLSVIKQIAFVCIYTFFPPFSCHSSVQLTKQKTSLPLHFLFMGPVEPCSGVHRRRQHFSQQTGFHMRDIYMCPYTGCAKSALTATN